MSGIGGRLTASKPIHCLRPSSPSDRHEHPYRAHSNRAPVPSSASAALLLSSWRAPSSSSSITVVGGVGSWYSIQEGAFAPMVSGPTGLVSRFTIAKSSYRFNLLSILPTYKPLCIPIFLVNVHGILLYSLK